MAAASQFYSGTKYYTNPADPARQDDGLFGPGSITWRVVNCKVMWVAGFRSLYLQGLHLLAKDARLVAHVADAAGVPGGSVLAAADAALALMNQRR